MSNPMRGISRNIVFGLGLVGLNPSAVPRKQPSRWPILYRDRVLRSGASAAAPKQSASVLISPFRMPLRSGFPSSTGEVSGALIKAVARFLAAGAASPGATVRRLANNKQGCSGTFVCFCKVRLLSAFRTLAFRSYGMRVSSASQHLIYTNDPWLF